MGAEFKVWWGEAPERFEVLGSKVKVLGFPFRLNALPARRRGIDY